MVVSTHLQRSFSGCRLFWDLLFGLHCCNGCSLEVVFSHLQPAHRFRSAHSQFMYREDTGHASPNSCMAAAAPRAAPAKAVVSFIEDAGNASHCRHNAAAASRASRAEAAISAQLLRPGAAPRVDLRGNYLVPSSRVLVV
eukprot:1160596-Pelagomonas_calceolata.AAC.5